MLIVLCIFFPPAIPFVLLWYVLGNRSANREAVQVQKQILYVNSTTPEQRAAHARLKAKFELFVFVSVVAFCFFLYEFTTYMHDHSLCMKKDWSGVEHCDYDH